MRTPEDGFYKRFTVECSRVQIGERGRMLTNAEVGGMERGVRGGGERARGECSRVKNCGWGWEREAS